MDVAFGLVSTGSTALGFETDSKSQKHVNRFSKTLK